MERKEQIVSPPSTNVTGERFDTIRHDTPDMVSSRHVEGTRIRHDMSDRFVRIPRPVPLNRHLATSERNGDSYLRR
jgi:hypothetical protein